MSQFLLLLRGGEFKHYSEEEQQRIVQKYSAWVGALKKEGIYKAAEPLKNHGRILRSEAGQIVDGPFTETKEAVAGFFMIEAKDYDEAMEISKQCPHFDYGGYVELREVGTH